MFFTGNLHAGQVGWAIVFGILLALSIAVSLTAIVLKVVSTHRRIPPN